MIGDLEPYLADERQPFGTELVLDLAGCNPDIIGSRGWLVAYAAEVCALIGMRPYGEPLIEHFGHAEVKTAGFTLVQLIETSSIVGHFSEAWRTAYLNVFSCRTFDVDNAARFTQRYFGAEQVRRTVLVRR